MTIEGGDKEKEKGLKGFLIPFVSGGIAGIVAKSSIAPLERVKIIYQVITKIIIFIITILIIITL